MIKQFNGKNYLFLFYYSFYSCDEYIQIENNDFLI